MPASAHSFSVEADARPENELEEQQQPQDRDEQVGEQKQRGLETKGSETFSDGW
jgi:hypothetical protein